MIKDVSDELLSRVIIWDGSFSTARMMCGDNFVVDTDMSLLVGGPNDIMWAPVGDALFKDADGVVYSCEELSALANWQEIRVF